MFEYSIHKNTSTVGGSTVRESFLLCKGKKCLSAKLFSSIGSKYKDFFVFKTITEDKITADVSILVADYMINDCEIAIDLSRFLSACLGFEILAQDLNKLLGCE